MEKILHVFYASIGSYFESQFGEGWCYGLQSPGDILDDDTVAGVFQTPEEAVLKGISRNPSAILTDDVRAFLGEYS